MAIWFRTYLRRVSVRDRTVRHVARSILVQAGYPTAQLSLSFVGKTRMQSLNRRYRKRDYPTDVLAFPTGSKQKHPREFLGDVVICLPIAMHQAARFQNTTDQEILRLLIHGTLHLLGYDHEKSERGAARMERKEYAIFYKLSPVPQFLK